MVRAVGRIAVLPGSDIIAIQEAIVGGVRRGSQDEVLEAAEFLHALLMPEQRLSHFDPWFASHMIPLIQPGHPANPIVVSDNGRPSRRDSDSGYDSMPELEYPLSPLYIPRSPDA
jgi:hypothetical protein